MRADHLAGDADIGKPGLAPSANGAGARRANNRS